MKTGRNRLGRQDHFVPGRADCERPQRLVRWVVPLLVVATIALIAAPAQASTGGASTVASGNAQAGSGIAFAPMQWARATWDRPGLYSRPPAFRPLPLPHNVRVAHR